MESNRLRGVMTAATLAAFLAAGPALAQWQGCCGGCCGDYDPERVVSIKGTVERIEEHPRGGGWKGIHLILADGEDTFEVHIGPSFFLEENDFSFSPGDRIEVTGSRGTGEKVRDLIAREIKKKKRTLVLRDGNGKPMWAGGPKST